MYNIKSSKPNQASLQQLLLFSMETLLGKCVEKLNSQLMIHFSAVFTEMDHQLSSLSSASCSFSDLSITHTPTRLRQIVFILLGESNHNNNVEENLKNYYSHSYRRSI